MANAIYPKYKAAMRTKSSNAFDLSAVGTTVKAALVDTGTYTYSTASQYYDESTSSDVQSATVGTPVELTVKSVDSGTGAFKVSLSTVFTAVSGGGTTKDILEAIVLYVDTGTPTTSPLVAYIDTGVTGLPVTPNGGDITITWNAGGIFD